MRALDAARAYTRRGWRVIPIPRGKKKATFRDWQHLRLTEKELPARFSGETNIGLLVGEPSGSLADVDCDAREAVEAARELLPPTDLIHGRPSKLASHYWYRSPVRTERFQFPGEDGSMSMIVELRGTGTQTIVPPSLHPSGERLTWHAEGEPAAVDPVHLRRAVARVAACALLARHWPSTGSRDTAALALCGVLLRARWSEEEAGRFVGLVARIAGDEEWKTRDKTRQTAEKLRTGKSVTGAPTLTQVLRDGRRVVTQALRWLEISDGFESANTPPASARREGEAGGEILALPDARYPDPPKADAYYGLVGDLIRAIEPHTEADPVALLGQFLTAFGNAIGRHAHFLAGADAHHTNLFTVLVGATAGGRKGSSWGHVRARLEAVDPAWVSDHILGGLSSGEGLIHALRDGNDLDPGMADSRLLGYEPEFASVLKVLMRDGNTLSAILRQAWDGSPLRVLTKHSPEVASAAHVSIIGHITRDELTRYLNSIEAGNGFGNRFMWLCVRRSKYLPDGGDIRSVDLTSLHARLARALDFSRAHGELLRDPMARQLWHEVYRRLSDGHPGLVGAMTARAEPQVMRIACIFALLDCSPVVRVEHLRAALALWEYAEASVRYVFGTSLGDPIADAILAALRNVGAAGMTQTDLSNHFGRHVSAGELGGALRRLQELRFIVGIQEGTGGRPAIRWHLTTEDKQREESEESEETTSSRGESPLSSHTSLSSHASSSAAHVFAPPEPEQTADAADTEATTQRQARCPETGGPHEYYFLRRADGTRLCVNCGFPEHSAA